jgi:hypothetical protein
MSPNDWSMHYSLALANLRDARRTGREQEKQFIGAMKRIAFIATDCASDSEAPMALDSIRAVAYKLVDDYERAQAERNL